MRRAKLPKLTVAGPDSYPVSSHVCIGALDSVPKQVLLELFYETLRMGAGTVTLLEDKSAVLFSDLLADRLDIVVTNHLPLISGRTRLHTRLLARVTVSIYGTKKFAHLKTNHPQPLAQQPLIAPTAHSKLRYDMERFFENHHIQARVIGQTQDTGLQRLLGIRGLGLVALADFTTRELVSANRLVKLGTLKGVTEELWLASPRERGTNPIAARLMEEYSLKSIMAPVKPR